MPVKPESTKIHRAGISDEVTALVRLRWTSRKIVESIRNRLDIELTEDQVDYFRQRYVADELMLPPSKVQAAIRNRGAIIDVVSARAEMIEAQMSRVSRLLLMEKQIAEEYEKFKQEQENTGEDPKGKKMWRSRALLIKNGVREEMETLSRLLDAHKSDLIDLGVFTTERVGSLAGASGVNININAPVVGALELEEQLISGGMDACQARLTVLKIAFGPERLGDKEPVDVCAELLDDSGAKVIVPGSSVSSGAVRDECPGDSPQEGGTGRDK